MKNNFGFTLIELIVAITIGMLVVGFGSVSLNNFFENQKVESIKQELMSNLRFARNYAATNQFASNGNSLLVIINNDGLMTSKSYKKDGTLIGIVSTKNIGQKGVSIAVDKSIKFSVTDGRSINGVVVVTITGSSGMTKKIKIDESGLIYEE
ncbi:MAG: prepilin-type N-terminal cleavage/methylation domain-containing protein [Candidatus Shapirobacteria bacterium]|nr:prepilin-type N-terminal cleavage/methylation domain-containing protein [Candidatus Shapirobacteria bacterium]MDD3002321.1 prepilin-type N-terminal cleavage/methylation domain-containing protein [Candidatus Shapirobacteria bacterium]MDD4382674.1 prepilin-type N-terminal cleavage/methylation domain-containing protein [Candidatus Shapirobacteria bacterium]